MDIFLLFTKLFSAFSQVPAFSWAAIFVGLLASWISSKSARHFWRIRKAGLVLSRLQEIAIKSGPGAQFHYLRSAAVDPFTFEEAILSALKSRGFRIKRNRRYTGDGGIDGVAWFNGQKILIQAKLYSSYISGRHVEEFSRLCSNHSAHGLFVHSGKTGRNSKSFVTAELDIVSGDRLLKLLCNQPVVLFPAGVKMST